MNENIGKFLSYSLVTIMITSSLVFIEPSPYDVLMAMVLLVGFVFSIYKFKRAMIFPILMLCLFFICNLISIYVMRENGASLFFLIITFYLAITWIGLVGINSFINKSHLHFIFHGYLISACISSIIGILAYFGVLPYSDFFLMYGRVKAFFKDPNVYGPYLVIAALYALSVPETKNISASKTALYYSAFLLLVVGIILSFSRAAWGNLVLSLLVYLSIIKLKFIKRRLKTLSFLALIVIPVILFFIQTPMVEELLTLRLSYQGYDDDRFGTQLAAFESGLANPFGIGAGQSEYVFNYSPHSLYARVFTENGIIGLITLLLFILVSMGKLFISFWNTDSESGIIYTLFFACLVGLVFNSFFVDTLHWRHFWLVLAFAWYEFSKES